MVIKHILPPELLKAAPQNLLSKPVPLLLILHVDSYNSAWHRLYISILVISDYLLESKIQC